MDEELINQAFKQFESLMLTRIKRGVHTTEDSVRYTLFHCLTNYAKIDPNEVILEHPHKPLDGCFVDAYIKPLNSKEGIVFEFKYDRGIPSGKNSPRTQKAGKVFADLFRLACFQADQPVKRYFVYVTDGEMSTYFNNPANEVDDFYNLKIGETLELSEEYINQHASTFVNSVGENIRDCSVTCKSSGIFDLFSYRIYEVKPR